MLLLGVDVETTGVDTGRDRIIEIGCVVWDTVRKAPVFVQNDYVYDLEYPKLRAVITALTGIRDDDLKTYGIQPSIAWRRFSRLATLADYIVAHNGNAFDKVILQNEFKRANVPFPGNEWIDTMLDIYYPPSIQTRKLTHLAAEHGFANPFPHRAFADVLTMFTILSKYNLGTILQKRKLPSLTVVALVKPPWEDDAPDGQKETDLAKEQGFRWNGRKKRWEKIIKEPELEKEKNNWEFSYQIIKE